MVMKTGDPILGSARSTAAQAIAYAKNVGAKRLDDAIEYINAVYQLAPLVGIDPSVVIAQAVHETGGFSTFVDSPWWRLRLNPAGIGITGDTAQDNASKTFKTGTEAARAHIAHLLLYATGKIDKGGLTSDDDPRYSAYLQAHGNKPTATTIQGLQNTWGIDNSYAASMVKQGNAVFPSLPNTSPPVTAPSSPSEPIPSKEPPMATPVQADYSSLPFPVYVDLIPIGQTNQRPGQKQTVQFINIHETDNTSAGANAKMHNTWLHNGAPGAADTQVSVHFFVDDKQAYQTIPLNEISWNAGCGGSCLGNVAAISIELCVNSDGNYEKARDNVTRLVALLIKQLGLTKAAIKFHQDWSGKWCPRNILDRGLKQDTINKIVGYMDGYTPTPSAPAYADASPIVVDGVDWDGTSDVVINGITFHGAVQWVTAGGVMEAHQFADPTTTTIHAPYPLGMKVNVLGWVESTKVGDENRWWIGKDWARLFVGDTTEKPATTPLPPPQFDPPLPQVKVIDGRTHYPTSRAVKVTIKGGGWKRNAPLVAATKTTNAKQGDVIKTAYWCVGDNVRGDVLWWLEAKADGSDPFVNPSYIWAQVATDRPQ